MIQSRNFAVILACTVLAAGCSQKIDVRQLQQNNGLAYKIGDNNPYSGTVTNVPVSQFALVAEDGSCTVEMSHGLIDGQVLCATENGTKLYQAHWREGKKDGTEKVWFPQSGTVIVVREWKAGRKSGLEQRYNPQTTKLISEINWSDDQKAGRERRWNVNGDVLLVDFNWAGGKQTGISKAGEWEENYVDGKFDGVRRHFSTDDSAAASSFLGEGRTVEQLGGGASSAVGRPGFYLQSQDNWKNGAQEGIAKTWHSNGVLAGEALYKNGKKISLREWNDKGTLKRESYFEPDNPDLPSSLDGEAERRSYDEQGKVVETMCFRNDCPGLARIFPNGVQGIQPQAASDSKAAASDVKTTGNIGQCVYPKTNIAKNGYLELRQPVLLRAAPKAKEGAPLKSLTAFKVLGEDGPFIQIADKDTGKILGWTEFSNFEVQDLRNCNL